MRRRGLPRRRLRCYLLLYVVLLAGIIWQFVASGDFSLGRRPWQNLQRTAHELSRPSFLDVWFGNERLEYRAEDGRVLRVENQRSAELRFLRGLPAAVWTTFTIATLGSLLAALAALPFGLVSAKNMRLPRPIATAARLALDVSRAIHTLVFGLIIVGIIGLGPMAGVLAIAAHSFGSYGKLYAETIEAVDVRWIESGVALGLTPLQTLIHGLRITLLPRCCRCISTSGSTTCATRPCSA